MSLYGHCDCERFRVYCERRKLTNKRVLPTKNSAEIASQYIDSGSEAISAGTAIISVNAGDIITLNARTSSVGTAAPNNIATHLDIAYIR